LKITFPKKKKRLKDGRNNLAVAGYYLTRNFVKYTDQLVTVTCRQVQWVERAAWMEEKRNANRILIEKLLGK
jgi:hypothetical protein